MSDREPKDELPDGPGDDDRTIDDELTVDAVPGDDATRTASDLPAASGDIPPTIGDYRILGKLGEGGMGVVFEAEQRNPRRRVALKVVRGGRFVDEHRVRMFQREAESLARLKHPNIAAIYESGRTDDGQHFFAMELVRGQVLLQYLESRSGSLNRDELAHRLRMFKKTCDAVHYAHQRGVIHRDLKPDNIIVTQAGPATESSEASLPEVKILDFGLARITDTDVQATMVSEIGVIKGTLAYMSPEQARGDPDDIDVRTDVYALGIILYEMLTGLRPYDVQRASLIDAVRVICEQPPTPLRQHWSGERRLDPDLETIVGKALEKDAGQRYGSANSLALDIERYLTNQPIQARPPSTTYQLRKLVQRNRLPFAFAVSVLVLLIGFGIGMSVLFARAVRAEGAALSEAATANYTSGFMTDMFKVADPGEARGNSITAREILDRGAEKIRGELGDQPAIQSQLMETMGQVYRNLGLYPEARGLFEDNVKIQRDNLGHEHADVAASTNRLAGVLIKMGKTDEAGELLEQALAVQERELDADDPALARTLNNFGIVSARRHEWDRTRELWERALGIRERTLGRDHPDVAALLGNLSVAYAELDRFDRARDALDRAIEINRAELGDDAFKVASLLQKLAVQQHALEEYDDALASVEEALAIQIKTLDPYHPTLGFTYNTLGKIRLDRGESRQAEEALARSVGVHTKARGAGHTRTMQARQSWIESLLAIDDGARLDAAIADQLAALQAKAKSTSSSILSVRGELAEVLSMLGRDPEAQALLREGREEALRKL